MKIFFGLHVYIYYSIYFINMCKTFHCCLWLQLLLNILIKYLSSNHRQLEMLYGNMRTQAFKSTTVATSLVLYWVMVLCYCMHSVSDLPLPQTNQWIPDQKCVEMLRNSRSLSLRRSPFCWCVCKQTCWVDWSANIWLWLWWRPPTRLSMIMLFYK